MEILKNKDGLVYQLLEKFGKIGNHGKNGKNGFFRFQLKRNMEMLKNKHGLVYQVLGRFGNVEIMEDTEKMDFSDFN